MHWRPVILPAPVSRVAAPCSGLEKEMIGLGDYDAHYPLHGMQKDPHRVAPSVYEQDVLPPTLNTAKVPFQSAVRDDYGQKDHADPFQHVVGE
jgi:hypothetical protein